MLELGSHDEAGCVDRRQRAFIAHEDLAPLEAGLDRADRSRSGHLEKRERAMAALITAADLGIDTTSDQGLFDWLLASVLFGRPVPQQTAASAFRKFREDGWDTPEHFTADEQRPLWRELWEGNYHRMSSVVSEKLGDVMRAIIADYDGSPARLVRTASTREDISQRLQRIKGVGPKTAEIFLREVPEALIGTG